MTLRPFLTALALAATLAGAALAQSTPDDACTPNADGTLPPGCTAGVNLDP